jgi:hypothetical protein
VGHARVIVTLSNAITAVVVAASFPLSLTFAERVADSSGRWRHLQRTNPLALPFGAAASRRRWYRRWKRG